MRIAVAPLVVVGAALAVLEASANPIRIIAISSRIEVIPNNAQPGVYRVGLAGAPVTSVSAPAGRTHKGCGSMRAKAVELSNTLRAAVGLPPIESPTQKLNLAVMPGGNIILHPEDEENGRAAYLPHPRPYGGIMPPEVEEEIMEPSFVERIHAALVELGPWEARAVAFVLGCGIGVLLRMLWIFAVLVVRELSPSNEETASVEEVRMLAPETDELPEYSDEKVPAYTDDKTAIA